MTAKRHRVGDSRPCSSSTVTACCVIALFLTLLSHPTLGADSSNRRTLESETPAEGIDRLTLRAGDGSITVSPSSDDTIRARVEVTVEGSSDKERRPLGWFLTSRLERADDLAGAISISESVSAGQATLRLLPLGKSRASRTKEDWFLELPPRVFLELEANSATTVVSEVYGGIRLRQGHGKAKIDVPRGDLDLRLQVGTIEVRSAVDTWHLVDLRSRVGEARLWIDGRRIKRRQPPGPGARIEVEGRGETILEVDVEVGNVELRLDAGDLR